MILGISAYYHDSAAALIDGDEIIAAAQEERFSRIKHDPSFPRSAIRYCLEARGLTLKDIEAVVFYDKPFLKFERLLETYYSFAPKGLKSFIRSMPVWIKEKLFLKRMIKKELIGLYESTLADIPLYFSEHHLSHAASAYYPSPFKAAAILTIDGVGEWSTAMIASGNNRSIKVLREQHFPHSIGLLYSAFTYYLGFKVNNGEYKLMGLAPYGNSNSNRVNQFKELILTKLLQLNEDGSIWMDQQYFDYCTGDRMTDNKKWAALFGFVRRENDSEVLQQHCDLALAIQEVVELIVIKMAKEAKRLTGSDNLCLSGGVALNCVANGKLKEAKIFNNIYVQPASGDAGGSLGAALAFYNISVKSDLAKPQNDLMKGAYLGPSFGPFAIERTLLKNRASFELIENEELLLAQVAKYIDDGKVIGWFQGAMEFGPRALGNRSILADPRRVEMQDIVNIKIKFRESFRPFAPAILADKVEEYFQMDDESPYMLFVHQVSEKIKVPPPANYSQLSTKEKLHFSKSSLPAITHVDYSARIQTVTSISNPKFHNLLTAFYKLTGCPVLINTSFNVRGEPIVCTPQNGYDCFMKTDMDVLVIGNFIMSKQTS